MNFIFKHKIVIEVSILRDLPKVYAKPIEKKIQNNKEMFYSRLLEEKKDSRSILKEIDKIFTSRDFVYKSNVQITTKDEILETVLVGRNGSSLLTMDGKSILISTIKDIKKL